MRKIINYFTAKVDIIDPLTRRHGPLPGQLAVGAQKRQCRRALRKQRDHQLHALVRPLLVVHFIPLDDLQQALAVVGNAENRVVNPMILPRVVDEQNLQQQVRVMAHVVPKCVAAVPQKLAEQGAREGWVLIATVLQQFDTLVADVGVLDQLFDVAHTIEQILGAFGLERDETVVRDSWFNVHIWSSCNGTGSLAFARNVRRANQMRDDVMEFT